CQNAGLCAGGFYPRSREIVYGKDLCNLRDVDPQITQIKEKKENRIDPQITQITQINGRSDSMARVGRGRERLLKQIGSPFETLKQPHLCHTIFRTYPRGMAERFHRAGGVNSVRH
ncbi:MAG: hypothetical protein GWP10_15200, partial [Nitrospiraceae bacterium]|nr:hypothetical protein [Nitrospiraceae bacterium]